ncbi:MAG TPA: MYXO-CTERM sorting domain-containing protein, partial [Polyangiaceae bacterium]
ATDARACSCPARNPSAILASDAVAVVAAIVSPEEVADTNHAYRVRVDTALKGAAVGAEETVVLARSDSMCGGMLEPGRTYALFGSRGHCGEIRIDPCEGSWLVDRSNAKSLSPTGVTNFTPPLAAVRPFPKETLASCNPILGPRNMQATCELLSLGELEPKYSSYIPVRLRIVDTNDPGDANGQLRAGQELDVRAFSPKLDPASQTATSCIGPHNKPGQRVKVSLVVPPADTVNMVSCTVVPAPPAPIASGTASADAGTGPARKGGCSCTAGGEGGLPSAVAVASGVLAALLRRRRRR